MNKVVLNYLFELSHKVCEIILSISLIMCQKKKLHFLKSPQLMLHIHNVDNYGKTDSSTCKFQCHSHVNFCKMRNKCH